MTRFVTEFWEMNSGEIEDFVKSNALDDLGALNQVVASVRQAVMETTAAYCELTNNAPICTCISFLRSHFLSGNYSLHIACYGDELFLAPSPAESYASYTFCENVIGSTLAYAAQLAAQEMPRTPEYEKACLAIKVSDTMKSLLFQLISDNATELFADIECGDIYYGDLFGAITCIGVAE